MLACSSPMKAGQKAAVLTLNQRRLFPHPSELSQSLGFDHVWLFPTNFAWAIRTGHEDWDRLELFQKPDARDDDPLE